MAIGPFVGRRLFYGKKSGTPLGLPLFLIKYRSLTVPSPSVLFNNTAALQPYY